MRKLSLIFTTAVLLIVTACSGSFIDPGMLDQPGGGDNGSSGGSGLDDIFGGIFGGIGGGGGGGGDGSKSNPYTLTKRAWKKGTITSSKQEIWYSFNVTPGQYCIWLNDKDGNGSYTFDAAYQAFQPNSDDNYFFTITSDSVAWTSGKTITPSISGTVKVKVTPKTPGDTGSFAIVYSDNTNNTRP